jgi:hypothetical protein
MVWYCLVSKICTLIWFVRYKIYEFSDTELIVW